MAQHPVTFAIIGAGLIGPRHASAILNTPSAKLACFVDSNPAAQEVVAGFNVPLYPTIADMLASTDKPQAAIVCTPNHTHVPISKGLLDAGISVLCEKPIATDIASAMELLEHAKKSTAKLAVGHHRRFNRYVRATKAALPSLGRAVAVSGLWTICKPSEYFEGVGEWRKDGTNGGPILINLRNFDAEEGVAVLIRFASGCVGTFVVSDAVPSPHNFESGTGENPTIPARGMDFYRIFGTDASLSVPDMKRWSYDGKVKDWTQDLEEDTLSVGTSKVPFELQVEQITSLAITHKRHLAYFVLAPTFQKTGFIALPLSTRDKENSLSSNLNFGLVNWYLWHVDNWGKRPSLTKIPANGRQAVLSSANLS
ncbi:hypothetical protein E4T42_07045 [Aureobasidium subglaciale]|nr:hypothetical protein E4T42_07045 [Aureobasidium subglaciale]